jgi:2-dehydropantoate 2-reductase
LSKKNIKIGVIGAGSIGSLFGGYLAAIKSDIYNVEVFLFGRKKHMDAINKNGLTVDKGQQTITIKNMKTHKNSKNLSIIFDYLFITTKTYDLKNVLVQFQSLIESCKYLVILQNGIGNEMLVKQFCSEEKIIRAVTINGVFLDKPGHLIYSGEGLTKIGFPFMRLKKSEQGSLDLQLLKDLLDTASLNTIIVDDIIKECWEKAFINIGINAFGALTRLKNGQLLEIDGLKKLMAEAINESLLVAKQRGIQLSDKDYISLTYEIAKKTAENKNSMLQDILKGKNTEINFLNGIIVEYAKELEISVPINDLLTKLIKGLEQSIKKGDI